MAPGTVCIRPCPSSRGAGTVPGDGRTLGLCAYSYHLAQIERREGKWEAATDCYQQSLHLFVTLENRHMIARCLAGLGGVALAQAQWERAGQLLGTAQQLFAALPSFLRLATERSMNK